MQYDFDKIIDRDGTMSIKYDAAEEYGWGKDTIPLWIADMDFESAPHIREALLERARHGVFGYSAADDSYFEVLKAWFGRRFGWALNEDWLVTTPGVITTIFIAIRKLTRPGDAVLLTPPVYHFFEQGIVYNGRRAVYSPLVYENGAGDKNKYGHYAIDFADFERKIRENSVKMFILCNPHNPISRVWTKEELETIGDICKKYEVLVVSDEIFEEFVFGGKTHQTFASVKPEFARFTITCTSPTKTFNISGLPCANIFIEDFAIREKIQYELFNGYYPKPGIFELTAAKAAYSGGEAWLSDLKTYLEDNIAFVKHFLAENLPRIRLAETEGTYLLWLDFNKLEPVIRGYDNWLSKEAKLFMSGGKVFGKDGEGFQRLNIACPRATLEKALAQLKAACNER
jgi:cystathionine beta-lyase